MPRIKKKDGMTTPSVANNAPKNPQIRNPTKVDCGDVESEYTRAETVCYSG